MNLWKVDVDHLHQGSLSTFVQGPGCFMPWSHYVICYLQLLSIAVEVFHRTWPIRQHRKEVAQAVHVVCALICFTKKKKEKGKWMCMRGWIALKTCNFLLVLWFSEDTRPQIYIVYLCLNSDRNYKLLSGTCKLHIQNRQVAAYHKSAANSSCLI